ncbi:alginate export family protein [Solitalea sp. MAHUQ-68]|uniref:Alginate export family protein n=1 Tax=Solitalea agri TaxID=2953739 RepID=A0A9X2F4L5_9SPHI|nr:alginate export family protein [Solitalea agri]MCO4294109.1 alginate export family protein [Solitalea agri]
MYLKNKLFAVVFTLFLIFSLANSVHAQLSINAQIRARAEYRNGFSNLLPTSAQSADFISQRTRLGFGYRWNFLVLGGSLQDVRVWGQDASSISNSDGNKLMLHEGWAEVILANKDDSTNQFKLIDYLSFKIGRQELIYDDSRLIGNLDWMQQARRFDMALLKAVHKGWQLDLGYAYNQNSEKTSGNYYVPGNVPQYVKNDHGVLVPTPEGMVPLTNSLGNSDASGNPTYTNPPTTNGGSQDYKKFISVYLSKSVKNTKLSALFFNDKFGKYRSSSVETNGGLVYGRYFDVDGNSSRYTYGLMAIQSIPIAANKSSVKLQLNYYEQSGHDRDAKKLSAYHYSAFATYNKGKFSAGPGYDYLSGNKTSIAADENSRFDPLYGTPHKFWGYMDYFYAGSGSPPQGLKNAYLKSKFTNKFYSLALDYHHFAVANELAATTQKSLGDEFDFTASCTLNKFTTLDFGYSMMFATNAMAYAKGQSPAVPVTNFDKTAQWAYLSVTIKPEFLFTKQSPSKL